MKKMTVVIGNYNYDRFLGRAIESALAQDPERTAVIVIDDGSTDRSRDVIERFGSRIRAVFKENEGQVSVYNLGLELAETEYVLFLDSDDVLYDDAVSRVLDAFERNDCVKVQFRLDVIGENGARTGVCVPNSTPPRDCARMLEGGWLYPSPPASGNAYRVDALKAIFPIPAFGAQHKAADFFAIYGVALVGGIGAIDMPLGAYRVHRLASIGGGDGSGGGATPKLSIGNSEGANDVASTFPQRWDALRSLVRERLGVELPAHFADFSFEKNDFGLSLYDAPTGRRWHWLMFESGRYFHALVGNPFWSRAKKAGVIALTMMCLLPSRRLSNFAIRYLVNPASRRRGIV